MKGSELIKEIQSQVEKHGDCDIYYEYDSGIRIMCEDVYHFKKIPSNDYSDHWEKLENVFIINHEE